MNAIPKVVFSKSLLEATLTDSRIVSGDTVEEVKKLKALPGGAIMTHGGIKFLRSLAALDVDDEYRLLVYPYVAGRG